MPICLNKEKGFKKIKRIIKQPNMTEKTDKWEEEFDNKFYQELYFDGKYAFRKHKENLSLLEIKLR